MTLGSQFLQKHEENSKLGCPVDVSVTRMSLPAYLESILAIPIDFSYLVETHNPVLRLRLGSQPRFVLSVMMKIGRASCRERVSPRV